MGAMDPLVEKQAAAILERLQDIGVGSGWHVVPSLVSRPWKIDTSLHLQIGLFQSDPEPTSDGEVLNHDEWWQHWDIWLCVVPAENDSTALDTYINRMAADVKKALDGSESSWLKFGVDYVLSQAVPFDPTIPLSGAIMDLAVHMRINRGEPDANGGPRTTITEVVGLSGTSVRVVFSAAVEVLSSDASGILIGPDAVEGEIQTSVGTSSTQITISNLPDGGSYVGTAWQFDPYSILGLEPGRVGFGPAQTGLVT